MPSHLLPSQAEASAAAAATGQSVRQVKVQQALGATSTVSYA